MALPTPKVEVGFDLTDSPIGPFFRLDDPVRGVLDNTQYVLGGTIFIDITDRVRTIRVQRGRARNFANYTAGALSVEINNHDRAFDPLFTASPYYGNIVPRREIRISSGGVRQFTGWIDDWDLTYTPDGNSIATATAYDAFMILAKQSLTGETPAEELTGARINRALDDAKVNWAADQRDIAAGQATVGAITIEPDTNVLTYLQQVALADPGELFMGKNGYVVFKDRAAAPSSSSIVVLGEGGIPFKNVQVVYGTEDLYNNVVVSRVGGGTAVATDEVSQGNYGIRTLEEIDLLLSSDAQVADRASVLVNWYSEPEYRFDSVEIELHKRTEAEQASILGLELGSFVQIVFTPNGISPAIDRVLEVIKLEHTVTPTQHFVTIGFQATQGVPFVLDDLVFGKLDEATLGW